MPLAVVFMRILHYSAFERKLYMIGTAGNSQNQNSPVLIKSSGLFLSAMLAIRI